MDSLKVENMKLKMLRKSCQFKTKFKHLKCKSQEMCMKENIKEKLVGIDAIFENEDGNDRIFMQHRNFIIKTLWILNKRSI